MRVGLVLCRGTELWCGWGMERKKSHIWMERGSINQDGDSRRGHMVPSASAHPVHANTVTLFLPTLSLSMARIVLLTYILIINNKPNLGYLAQSDNNKTLVL